MYKKFFRLVNIFRSYSQGAFRNLYKMQIAYFRYNPEEPQLLINFRYVNPNFNVDRDFNFSRNINENVQTCLDRMKNNIAKELDKKSKKKKVKKSSADESETPQNIQTPEVLVELLWKDNVVNGDTVFSDLLTKVDAGRKDLRLKILEDEFQVAYNTPWVLNLNLPTSILAGFLLYPCKLELQFTKKEDSKANWYKGRMPKSNNIKDIEWEKVHEGMTYKTTTEDIDHYIKFEFIPINGSEIGPSAECISKNTIQAGPGQCPFEIRHKFTQTKLSNRKFRITSYNILADLYADSDYTRKELFPYCPPYALHIDYRKQLFIKEIMGYNSDIICLQEVDRKIFDFDLLPVLNTCNYDGSFLVKGKTAEGLATFYDTNRLQFINNYGFTIGENLEKLEVFDKLWKKIQYNEQLVNRVVDRSTALQATLLRSKEMNHYFLVANTHLYFHPDADHIRLLQFGFSMLYLEDLYKKVLEENHLDNTQLSLLFCGDFNSVPECGIYKLMTQKHVENKFIDWRSNEEEAVEGVSLDQPFNIESACGCPKYTNFTTLFSACLDYIFYQTDNLQVEEVIPLPTEEELRVHGAIPSVVFPSDHIALVADLKLK